VEMSDIFGSFDGKDSYKFTINELRMMIRRRVNISGVYIAEYIKRDKPYNSWKFILKRRR
jgi:hypothetical protein